MSISSTRHASTMTRHDHDRHRGVRQVTGPGPNSSGPSPPPEPSNTGHKTSCHDARDKEARGARS